MNIPIVTLGSRGDVQPFVALGKGLQEAGHDVTLVTGEGFESFVAERGLPSEILPVNYRELAGSDTGKEMMEGNVVTIVRYIFETLLPKMRTLLDTAWEVTSDADALIYHPKFIGGIDVAERLDIPCAVGSPIPIITPTRAFPAPGVAQSDLGGLLNRLTYTAAQGAALPYHRTVNRWRRETLGLPKRSLFRNPYTIDGTQVPVLYGVSPSVVAPPDDWPDTTHATGYWFLDEANDWTPDTDLVDFLDTDAATVYVGFGSMSSDHIGSMIRSLFAAIDVLECQVVLATGWGGELPDEIPDSVYVIDAVPHDWLFPKVDAVVHHGGAGTTAAGLRAGAPTLVCPFFGDQPFWGERVHDLGVGPAPLPPVEVTPETLTVALREAMAPDVADRAQQIGARIRREDGVDRALSILHRQWDVDEVLA